MKLNELAEVIEEMSPLTLQEEWDNSGFQIKLGNPEITRVLVGMEINSGIIDEAVRENVQVIVVHHPMIFDPISTVDNNDIIGNFIIRLVKAGISVYSSHTPFDICCGGNNDYLAHLLHLSRIEVMKEDRDGFCRVGYIDEDLSVAQYIEKVSSWLNLDKRYIKFAGNLTDKVRKVGLCSGAGGGALGDAVRAGCDLFVTGDVKHQLALEAGEMGINLLDVGHYGSEVIFAANMGGYLRQHTDAEILESRTDFNPFVLF